MKHFNLFCFLFLCILGLVQCSSEDKNTQIVSPSFLDDKTIGFEEKMDFLFNKNGSINIPMNEIQVKNVRSLYSKISFKPIFHIDTALNLLGQQMEEILLNPLPFGLAPSRIISLDSGDHWVVRELKLASNLTTILGDLNFGFIDFDSVQFKPINLYSCDSILGKTLQQDSIDLSEFILSQGPADTNYRFLANTLYKYCKIYPTDTTTFSLKNKKEDTLNYEQNIILALQSKGFLKDTSNYDWKNALREFKSSCGFENSSIVTDAVLSALSESTEQKIIRAGLTLDKLRQQKKKEKKHVRVNLPSFLLYFVAEEKVQSKHRVIIGKNKTQTPEFTAKINTIVSFPFWKVPHSISDNEILPAVRRNKAYLEKHHYRIYQNGQEIDPQTVDFSKYYKRFPFTTIQDPGPENSLGILKILFYNEHGVYVHDTPTKYLFRRDYRSFSHGCMRCEKPIELAKVILDFDSISPTMKNEVTRDSLDYYIENEIHQKIKLKRSIPIYIEYNTVTADEKNIYFHNDLYARESKLIALYKQ